MPITKAIIPVAGWGTRRLPITKIIEKSMLPVGNRPLVDYSVQELVKAGVTDIYMVISNVEPCQVREFYKDNLALNLYLEARGKADRLELAKTLPEGVRIHYTSQDPSGKYGTAVPVAMVAEEYNIKIGFEGCGRRGWYGGSTNIGYCDEAWELMFDAVPSQALGLEWEPSHIIERLGDPIMQLRHWADRVVHLHGKDCTIDWDIIKRYGIEGPKEVVHSRTPGFGETDWSKIFTILLQAGFNGSCDIEGYHDPVHYDDMEWTAQVTSMEYLKRCRGGIEYFAGPTEYRGYQGTRKK